MVDDCFIFIDSITKYLRTYAKYGKWGKFAASFGHEKLKGFQLQRSFASDSLAMNSEAESRWRLRQNPVIALAPRSPFVFTPAPTGVRLWTHAPRAGFVREVRGVRPLGKLADPPVKVGKTHWGGSKWTPSGVKSPSQKALWKLLVIHISVLIMHSYNGAPQSFPCPPFQYISKSRILIYNINPMCQFLLFLAL